MKINWKNPRDLVADVFNFIIWRHLIKYTGVINISIQAYNVEDLSLDKIKVNLTHEDILQGIDLNKCLQFVDENRSSDNVIITTAAFTTLYSRNSSGNIEIEMHDGLIVALKKEDEPIQPTVNAIHKRWRTLEEFIRIIHPEYSEQQLENMDMDAEIAKYVHELDEQIKLGLWNIGPAGGKAS